MIMAKRNVKSKSIRYPLRSAEVPVTQKMLVQVRDELKAMIKAEIHGVRSEFHGMKSDIHGMKSEIHGVKSEVQGLKSQIHEIKILVEEQNARNALMMDGLTNLFYRQDRLEKQVADLKR